MLVNPKIKKSSILQGLVGTDARKNKYPGKHKNNSGRTGKAEQSNPKQNGGDNKGHLRK